MGEISADFLQLFFVFFLCFFFLLGLRVQHS